MKPHRTQQNRFWFWQLGRFCQNCERFEISILRSVFRSFFCPSKSSICSITFNLTLHLNRTIFHYHWISHIFYIFLRLLFSSSFFMFYARFFAFFIGTIAQFIHKCLLFSELRKIRTKRRWINYIHFTSFSSTMRQGCQNMRDDRELNLRKLRFSTGWWSDSMNLKNFEDQKL